MLEKQGYEMSKLLSEGSNLRGSQSLQFKYLKMIPGVQHWTPIYSNDSYLKLRYMLEFLTTLREI